MTYRVVTLSRYPELAERLIESIRKTHAQPPPILVIGDGHAKDFGAGTRTLYAPSGDGFCYARNANLGLVDNERLGLDTLLINDDVEICEPASLDRLAKLAATIQHCGILAPMVDGGVGNPVQDYNQRDKLWKHAHTTVQQLGPYPVCFVCVWINRRMVDEVGFMDEGMIRYGFDDNDMCIRARRKGWKTCITRMSHVKHGTGGAVYSRGANWSTSYARAGITETNEAYFTRKYSPSQA